MIGKDVLLKKLKLKQRAASRQNCSVMVGYKGIPYQVYVHEDLSKRHGATFNEHYADDIAAGRTHARRPQEKAKFLTDPLHENERQVVAAIVTTMTQVGVDTNKSLQRGLLVGGNLIKTASLEVVPIDTGDLSKSAFVGVDR